MRALEMFARQEGLRFSPKDSIGVIDPSLPLFQLGKTRDSANVMWGSWQGLPIVAADYWYTAIAAKHQPEDRFGYSVVVVKLSGDVWLPTATITHNGRLGAPFGSHPISFESEGFNEMFDVYSRDREFAFRLIDARMMEWLLSTNGRYGFEVSGRKILVYAHRQPPAELVPIIGTAKAFHDHLPKLVRTEYASRGKGPSPDAVQAAQTLSSPLPGGTTGSEPA